MTGSASLAQINAKARKVVELAPKAAMAESGNDLPMEESHEGGYYDGVLGWFTRFTEHTPSPSRLSSISETLNSCFEHSDGVSITQEGDLDNTKLVVNKWESEAIRSFNTKFLNMYPNVSGAHATAISTMASTLTVYQRYLESMRTSLLDIADKACNALQGIIDEAAQEKHDVSVAAFNLLISVVGVGAAAPMLAKSGAQVAGAALSFVSAASSAVDMGTKIAAEGIDGRTVHSILATMMDLLDEEYTRLSNNEDTIIEAFTGNASTLRSEENQSKSLVVLPKPAVTKNGSF